MPIPSNKLYSSIDSDDEMTDAEKREAYLIKMLNEEDKEKNIMITFEEILNQLDGDVTPDNFNDLDEIDSDEDFESIGPKYAYFTSYHKHKPTGRYLSYTCQHSAYDREWLSFESVEEVEQKQVTTTKWCKK